MTIDTRFIKTYATLNENLSNPMKELTPMQLLLQYVEGLPTQSNSEEIICIKERIRQSLPKEQGI